MQEICKIHARKCRFIAEYACKDFYAGYADDTCIPPLLMVTARLGQIIIGCLLRAHGDPQAKARQP
jgi:hypothetical protein